MFFILSTVFKSSLISSKELKLCKEIFNSLILLLLIISILSFNTLALVFIFIYIFYFFDIFNISSKLGCINGSPFT